MARPTFDVPKKEANSCSGYLNAVDPAAAEASFRKEGADCRVRRIANVSPQATLQATERSLTSSAAIPTPASSPGTRMHTFATACQALHAEQRVPVLRIEVFLLFL